MSTALRGHGSRFEPYRPVPIRSGRQATQRQCRCRLPELASHPFAGINATTTVHNAVRPERLVFVGTWQFAGFDQVAEGRAAFAFFRLDLLQG